MADLKGLRVAILVDNGFEQVELTEPRAALDTFGAETRIVSPQTGTVRGWNHTEWGDSLKVDVPLSEAHPEDFDALLLPGGVMNPDHLRMNPDAVRFAKWFFQNDKPVAAICHGPWMIVECGAAKGQQLTSWPSLKTDIRNAGGDWVDNEVIYSGNLVTSRKPDDIPAFNRSMIELFRMALPQLRRAG